MTEIIFVSKTFSPIQSLVPAQPLFSGSLSYHLGVKRPILEVYHLHPSNENIKNEWSYASTPLTCL